MSQEISMDDSVFFRTRMVLEMKKQGLDRAKLSRMAGLNARAVQDIEEGRSASPKLGTCSSIAGALGYTLSEFLRQSPRNEIIAELSDFLSQYSEQDQRLIFESIHGMSYVLSPQPDKED